MKTRNNQKKKLTILDKIILGLNLVFAITLLLSYLAPITDPREFGLIAILGFAYQILILVNIVFVLYWLARAKLYALTSAACILLGFNTFASYYKFSSSSTANKKQDSTDMRIMEYNVHEFKGIEESDGEPSQDKILKLINDKQPDILALEEYYKIKPDSDTVANSVKKILASDYCYVKPFKKKSKLNDSAGVALFSKYPIINSGFVQSPAILNTEAIFIDVKYRNKIFRVYCVHLAAVQIKARAKSNYLKGKVNLDNSGFIFGKLSGAFIERSYQVSLIKRDLEKCPYPYIVLGDFNDTPNSFSVNKLGDGLKNTFIEKGSGLGVTYNSKFPKLQIDYILVNPQFETINYEVPNKKISDHFPVITDLRLK